MRNLFIVMLCVCLCGCGGRSFWAPEWDKAETERKQFEELQKQTTALERIADALERIER